MFADCNIERQSQRTTERIHDDVRDVGCTDGEAILNDFNHNTEREYDGNLIEPGNLFEIDTEHHTERNEGDEIRDHFTIARVGKRNEVKTSRLKITYDSEGVVGKFE